ncbi:MAG TPA: PGF-CTERM sorting domain-containing protein, partial [Methanomicrobiales archaeon]|nr:PGF-CTERM sorting domain-containing protein [Methanomicrobiales archaeon]
KEKVNDDKYLITVSAKYTINTFGYSNTQTQTQTIPVVRMNGDWKVVQRLPGFEAVLGMLALLGVGYRLKGRA